MMKKTFGILARVVGFTACLALFVLFFIATGLGILNIGNLAGMVICVAGMAYFALMGKIHGWLRRLWRRRAGKVLLPAAGALLGLCIALAGTLSGLMVHTMLDTPEDEQVLVVLGCQVRANGVPSLMLRHRLDAALSYLNAHPDAQAIVCGGQGSDEVISEAACMYEYLTNHGVAPERIQQDDTSTSTYENLRNAKALLDGETKITIVTDGYHQYRASLIAEELGLETDHISAKTSWYLVPTYWVREWFGICYQVVFG